MYRIQLIHDSNDRFWDMRSDWVQTEVSLDYVVPMLTLSARALVNGTGDPYYTQLSVGSYDEYRPKGYPCDDAVKQGCVNKRWRAGRIALGVIVGVLCSVVVGLGVWWLVVWWRRRKRTNY